MLSYVKSLFFILGISFLATTNPAGAASPTLIDSQKFTCKQLNDVFREEIDNKVIQQDGSWYKILMWFIGKIIKDDFISVDILDELIKNVIHDCRINPSSPLITSLAAAYKNLNLDKYKVKDDLSKFTCQNVEAQQGTWTNGAEVVLSVIDGHTSASQMLDLQKQRQMFEMVFKECQQQPDALLLPLMKTLNSQ